MKKYPEQIPVTKGPKLTLQILGLNKDVQKKTKLIKQKQ